MSDQPISRRACNPIRLPCKAPGCNRWFANKSGLMQHINRIHPMFFLHNIPLGNCDGVDDTPMDSNSELQPDDGSYSLNDDVVSEEIDSQWYGPGAMLYRNYHTTLNGKFCIPSWCTPVF